jgi:hypothetical protein
MKYKIEQIVDDIDILELTYEEYERFNTLFQQAIERRYPQINTNNNDKDRIGSISKIILTEGPLRAEFIIKICDKQDTDENINCSDNSY